MKKLLMFVLLLLLTGCSVEYDLTITDKEKVIEEFKIYVDNEEILSSYSSIEEYLDYYSNLYKANLGYDEFNIISKKSNPQSYFIVNNEYLSLDSYIGSLSFKSMFTSATIERVGNYITFTTSGNSYLESIKNGMVISEEEQYEEFKISIKFYNEVTDSNADLVDEKNNVYTWIVNEDSDNNYIYFKIGPSVRYDVVIMDYIQDNIVAIAIIGGLIIVMGGVILFIIAKSKKNNEV